MTIPTRSRAPLPDPLLLAALGLYALLHLPSLFEPPWHVDEAGYTVTAWLAAHGAVLYSGVWNNKPPLIFWTYELAQRMTGVGELGIHLLAGVAGLVTVAACWRLVRGGWSRRRAGAAALLAAALLGTPILNGDLALPEDFLIAATSCGMLLVLAAAGSAGGRRRAAIGAAAGLAFALAVLYQQTALGDLTAALVFLALLPGRRGWGALAAIGITALAVVAAAVAPFVVMAGARNVSFLLVTSFLGYTRATLPVSLTALLPRAAAGGLWALGAVAARRTAPRRQLLWLWLGAVLLVGIAPDRPYIHFVLPAVVPAAALLAGTRRPSWLRAGRRWGWRPALRGSIRRVPLAASAAISVVTGVLLLASVPWGYYTIGLTLGYYPGAIAHAIGLESTDAYRASFGAATLADQVAAQWIDDNHLAGRSTVVWSSDAWLYPLAHLQMVLPTSNLNVDEALLGSRAVLRRVTRAHPSVVVTTARGLSAFPQVDRYLGAAFRRMFTDGTITVWERRARPRRPGR